MKKVLIACMLGLCCAAQPAMAQNDAKAKSILDAVTKKINSLKSLQANFALHLAASNGKVNETKKGTFYMKGPKYFVQLNGQEIICDNKTVWTYNKEAKEVQVNNYNPNEQTLSPSKLFTNFYDKEYKYHYVGERKVAGKACNVVELVPVSAAKQFSKVELVVDKTSNMITSGNIWEKNGNKYQYDISNVKTNANIPDTYFTFDTKTHPGVEVVDLR